MQSKIRAERFAARKALESAGTLAFKPISSAKWTNFVVNWRGSILVQIEHDDIKGVTPEMLKWWFENMSGKTSWNGTDFSGQKIAYYHLWHHRDHIRVTPITDAPDGSKNRGFRVGAISRIEERFNDINEKISQVMLTTKLDYSEFNFDILGPGGFRVGHVLHRYRSTLAGVSFYVETLIDSQIPIVGPILNWCIRPFVYSKITAENWIKHNIEESGRTENILPLLYQASKEEGGEEENIGKLLPASLKTDTLIG